jgi:internalin A
MPSPKATNPKPVTKLSVPDDEPADSFSFFWTPPDRSKFVNPWDLKPLLGYYRDLLTAYGYIRLLGLPQLKDNPDIPLESLFVEPEFSESPILPDAPLEEWPNRSSVTDALINHPHLVVLGDPGAGKTSLQSWLVTQFCRSGSSRLQSELGPLVPMPIVLRELALPTNLNWSNLLDLFLAQPTAHKLRECRGLLEGLLLHGQIIVMLDGLDEISNEAAKGSLKNAVVEGMVSRRQCRWLITSRIVGYDQMPFHMLGSGSSEARQSTVRKALYPRLWPASTPLLVPEATQSSPDAALSALVLPATEVLKPSSGEFIVSGLLVDELDLDSYYRIAGPKILDPGDSFAFAKRLFLSPFDDRQVEALVHKWYAEREANPAVREECIRELLSAIRENPSTQRLARIPNLLTMMALIHRVRARLPQGRVNLYADITDAYLQTIDDFRGLKETAYTLPQKKLWLAHVAFQMQVRRKVLSSTIEQEQREGILVERAGALKWLEEVMDVADPQDRKIAAERFLDYLQRRTGLFIERSPGQWAFLHLSFQEYFAACFLAEEVTSPDWLSSDYSREGCHPSDLQQFADSEAWKESLVFLFELLGQERPRWSDRVASKVFEKALAKPREQNPASNSIWRWQLQTDVRLLAELSVNAYCSFSTKLREEAWAVVWRCSFPSGAWSMGNPAADALFAAAPQFIQGIWRVCSTVASQYPDRPLNLCRCQRAEDISPLAHASTLKSLFLSESNIRRGLAGMATLSSLRTLELNWPGNLDNPSELIQFVNLRELGVRASASKLDLKSLASILLRLQRFYLYSYQDVEGFEALRACDQLSDAGFSTSNENETYSFLHHLLCVRYLWLNSSSVVQRLRDLPIRSVLDSLYLYAFHVLEDLDPPAQLQKVRDLRFVGCPKLSDLSPLSKLPNLEYLELNACPQVMSMAPLTQCPKLSSIIVRYCPNLHDVPQSLKSKIKYQE